jgi:hypothetical protein
VKWIRVNAKLMSSLHLTEHHSIKMYGEMEVQLQHSYSSDGLNGQL